MAIDLRQELNDCDSTTGFVGDGTTPATDNTVGFVYEGTNSISTQHSNADEHIYTTTRTGGGSFPVDLSDATVYLIVKDNLVQTIANGGVQWVLGDGTNRIGHGCGGNDETGIQLDVFWNSYKFDVTTTPPYTNQYAGGAVTYTAITQVGLGTFHLAKAQGNVDNIKLDRMSFHANGSYALRAIPTLGTTYNTSLLQGDSATGGIGLVANPFGSAYVFYAPTEFGSPVADTDMTYTAEDEQWTLLGGRVGDGHFPFRIVGNATDNISVTFTNVAVSNVGTRSDWIIGDANVNTIDWDNVTWTDIGTMTFAPQSATKTHDSITWNNCDQVTPNGCNGTEWTFNGGFNANGAMLLDTSGDCNNLDGVTFTSDGTGHAIEISVAGTYDFNNFTFSNYGADGTTDASVYISANVAVTINITGGDVPTVRDSGTAPTINATVPVKIIAQDDNGNAIQNAKVFLELVSDGTDVIPYGVTDVNGEVNTTFGGTTPANVTGYVAKGTSSPVYKRANINNTITSSGLTATITLVSDE